MLGLVLLPKALMHWQYGDSHMPKRLVGVFSVAALVLGACSNSVSTATPSGTPLTLASTPVALASTAPEIQLTDTAYQPVAAAHKGGSIVLAEWQYPTTLNPYYARTETDVEASTSMFSSLLTVTPSLRYLPDLAVEVPTVDNGDVKVAGAGMDVKWTLKSGMKWSDGQPINCDDIKATWQWNMDPAQSGLAGGTIGWEDVTGVDGGAGTNCVMHFGKVYEGYLTLVSPLLPAHYLSTVPVAKAGTDLYPLADPAKGVYSGPYIPTSAKADTQIQLGPNPNWGSIGGHAPYLDGMKWVYYGGGNPAAEIAGFKAGEFDVGQHFDESDIPSLGGIDPSQVIIQDSLSYEAHVFNDVSFARKFGKDYATVIQAIKMATDRQAIAAGPLVGQQVTIRNNFISPLAWFYEDVNATSLKADATSAATMLANAGWTRGPDGWLTRNGVTLSVDYCTTTRQVRVDTLKLVAEQLKKIGIQANLSFRPVSDVFGLWAQVPADDACNLIHGNFDVAELGWRSPTDPLVGYNSYVSTRMPSATPNHDGQNIAGVNLPAIDSAYQTIRSSVRLTSIRDAMYAIQNVYVSDMNVYELPLYFGKDVWLVNPRLHNFSGNPSPSAGLWNVGDWWVD